MTEAIAPTVTGSGLAYDHLGVLLLWTLAGALLVARRFRGESVEPSRSSS